MQQRDHEVTPGAVRKHSVCATLVLRGDFPTSRSGGRQPPETAQGSEAPRAERLGTGFLARRPYHTSDYEFSQGATSPEAILRNPWKNSQFRKQPVDPPSPEITRPW